MGIKTQSGDISDQLSLIYCTRKHLLGYGGSAHAPCATINLRFIRIFFRRIRMGFQIPHFHLANHHRLCSFLRDLHLHMSIINKKKSELKQAFRLEMLTMILLFIWEVDLIINTECRLADNGPDMLDYIYKVFLVFERRQMIKAIIIPCSMNLV